jgi:hypothetical protein
MRYRKKPIEIEAVQFEWKDGEGIPDIPGVRFSKWVDVNIPDHGTKLAPIASTAYIETLEGPLRVSRGDWIITGVKGERYPCKPDIFEATYEPVDVREGEPC